jgi:hypothetical protein
LLEYFFYRNLINLKGSSNRVYLKINEKEDGAFSHVDITISLRRRSLFYTFNYVIPSFMLTILSISGFVLPAESGEKIGLRKLRMQRKLPIKRRIFTRIYKLLRDHKSTWYCFLSRGCIRLRTTEFNGRAKIM